MVKTLPGTPQGNGGLAVKDRRAALKECQVRGLFAGRSGGTYRSRMAHPINAAVFGGMPPQARASGKMVIA